MIKITLFLLVSFGGINRVNAQSKGQIPAALVNKFAAQDHLFNQSEIFLHIDKSVYTPNENIWFKSYLLRSSADFAQQHTLFVFLSEKKSAGLRCQINS